MGDALQATASFTVGGVVDHSKTTITHFHCLPGKIDCQPIVVTTVYDAGPVKVTINGTQYSYTYGQNDSPSTIASSLANTIQLGGIVSASASGGTVTLSASAGSAGNSITLAVSSTSSDPTDFGTGSFPISASGTNFSGGENAISQSNAVLTATRHLTTTYTYDVLGDLLIASQGAMGPVGGQQLPGQQRTFGYDGLRRLTSSTTPEQGTIQNIFTTSSGLSCADDPTRICQIQDARNLIKTFTYDGINRVKTVAYSGTTPGQTYTYDNGGAAAFALQRLTKVAEGTTNSQTLTYDPLGRVTAVSNVIDASTYPVQYGYNPLNQVTSITYPSGRIISQGYDAIGRPSSTSSGGTTYLAVSAYNADNQPLNTLFGNGVQGSFTYNDHLQLSTLRYNLPSASTDVLNLADDYGTTNNGQIKTMHYYTVPGTEDLTKTESFTDDRWMRLQAAQTGTVNGTAGTWSLQWTYDRLGNRLSQTLVGGNVSIGQPQLAVDTSIYRITGFGFDASGNMTSDGVNTYSYDAANRLTQVNAGAGNYTYFGGLRIKKVVGSATTVYIYSADRPIAEYANGSLSKEYVYAGSRLLATLASGAATYHHPDHLSNRAETDSSGNVIRSFGHFPFGEVWYETPATDKWKFTTYERDSESGLDYASARFDQLGWGDSPRRIRFLDIYRTQNP